MIVLKYLFFILLIFTTSCSKIRNKSDFEVKNDSISNHKEIIEKKIVLLSADSKKLVQNWDEYQKFNDLILQYQNISIENALLSSTDLARLSQQLKDSIRVEKLNNPSVRIRLNVINNEVLRLKDMSTIPSIKSKSIIDENHKVMEAFSALNLKINSIIKQEKLNQDLLDINSSNYNPINNNINAENLTPLFDSVKPLLKAKSIRK